MKKMRRARYTLPKKLEALRMIGAGQSIAAVSATLGLAGSLGKKVCLTASVKGCVERRQGQTVMR